MLKETARQLIETIEYFLHEQSRHLNWANHTTAGKWNNKQIIGHLIDSAQINLQRFVRCTYEDGFKLIYFRTSGCGHSNTQL